MWTDDDPFTDPDPIAGDFDVVCIRCDARVAEMGPFCRTCHFKIQHDAQRGVRILAAFLASKLAETEPQEG